MNLCRTVAYGRTVISHPHGRFHMFITHLNIEVIAHSVDSDSMKTSICQVTESGAEHIWTPVCLKVIPDL